MANPMYGQNKSDEVLDDLGKMLAYGRPGGASLSLNKLEHTISAASTTNKTFTDRMLASGNGNAQVWGGYIEVSGISDGATVDLDFGHTNHLTIWQEAISANGIYGLDAPSFEATAEDVVITVTSNDSTTPIDCKIVLLACVPVTS
tara:strand:- start:355 stop:792 length:438 start_codon:yes stop_codon:yes gene_type:complete